ncbi:hypothetical protein ACQP2U_43555 (plasmid) [Nocardia sp. CA-084685]|uniref:hypothetical protein n=1 Tax=Nocardia sp. CA-084685 TaxID=3239970 RepID=UPI003D965A59
MTIQPTAHVGDPRTGSPITPSAAQLGTAREYLWACADMAPADNEELIAKVEAFSDEQVVRATLRMWPQGWEDFCTYFAPEIRDAEQGA